MQHPDQRIAGARVVLFTRIDHRHYPTGACLHVVNGAVPSTFRGLAICQYDGEDCCYLFYCNDLWEPVTDTWHQTVEDALAQAEIEFAGSRATWQPRDADAASSVARASCP